jgi:hypothetical protein
MDGNSNYWYFILTVLAKRKFFFILIFMQTAKKNLAVRFSFSSIFINAQYIGENYIVYIPSMPPPPKGTLLSWAKI